jgi:GNAT superfamily N-acetyltransferase
MPVVPDPAAPPAGRLLLAPDGALLARFLADDRDGQPLADLLEPAPDAPLADVVAGVERDLAGHRVAGPPALGRALLDRGALVRRHAHVMSRSLLPPLPEPDRGALAGLRVVPADRPAAQLAEAMLAAYPAEHPDFRPDLMRQDRLTADLDGILAGREVGPLLGCSRLAVDEEDRVAAAALVTRAPGAPPFGGPWIAELFRRPAHPGAGGALLRKVLRLAARAGEASMGLAVTDGNPARRLYEACGFALVLTSLTVELPARPA